MAHQSDRRVVLVGANPGVSLFDADAVTGFASVWQVDWSPVGPGNVLVLWRDGEVRLLGTNHDLARRLEREFTRFFPEAAGLPWPEPTVEDSPVRIELDLETGVRASAGDVTVTISDVLDRRAFATDEFDLGGIEHSLSLVVAPCGVGEIVEGGRPLPGGLRRGGPPDRPTSSAFCAAAEVWRL